VSWQIVPTVMFELLEDKDRTKSGRVMAALLQMKKLDIAGLKRAYEGQ
jgi:predicted 3-demethylubiquinone-9 3-methyltransferase (glyoxalase superfamily)